MAAETINTINSGGGRNDKIDILRLLLCWLIVLLHCPQIHAAVAPLSFTAVPCFFFISGYYLSRGNYVNNLKKAIRKIINIVFIATAIFGVLNFTPLGMFRDYSEYEGFFIDVFLLNDNPFSYHLWYLNAYLYALVVLYFFRNKQESIDKYIVPVVMIIITICVLFGKYSMLLFDSDFSVLLTRNFMGIAIPCLLCGRYIAKHEGIINRVKRYSSLLIVTFLVLSYCEFLFLRSYMVLSGGDLYFSTIPLALFLFIYTLNSNTIVSSKYKIALDFLAYCGRKYSLDVYIIHYPVLQLVMIITMSIFGDSVPRFYYIGISIIVLIASLLISYLFEKCIKLNILKFYVKN